MSKKKKSIERADAPNLNLGVHSELKELEIGKPIHYKNTDGEHVLSFIPTSVFGDKVDGVMHINTLATDHDSRFLVLYDEVLNPSQRAQKNSAVMSGIKDCYRKYFKTGDASAIPVGNLTLAVPPGSTIDNVKCFLTVNGGHRVDGAWQVAKEMNKHQWYPHVVSIYVGKTKEEISQKFVECNTQNAMGQIDLINASVRGGTLMPIYERFKDAEKRGLIGTYKIESAPVAYRMDKENTFLFGDLLGSIMHGFGDFDSTADILKWSNEISQEAVDNYLKVYYQFCKIVGRKGIEDVDINLRQLSCRTFQTNLARLSLVMPMTDDIEEPVFVKRLMKGNLRRTSVCNGLSKEHWLVFLRSLALGTGPGFEIRMANRDNSSAGGKGRAALWDAIVSKKVPIEYIVRDNGGFNDAVIKRTVTPDSNFPRHTMLEYFHNGDKSLLWKSTSVTDENDYDDED